MSAAPVKLKLLERPPRNGAVYGSRLLFGRYVPFRNVVIPGVEGFWLAASSLAAFSLSQHSLAEPGPRPWVQAGALTLIYLGAMYLMDLYDPKAFDCERDWTSKLVEAMGLVCVALSALQYAFGALPLPVGWTLLQVGLTAGLALFARSVIGDRLARRGRTLPVGFIGNSRARAELERSRDLLLDLGFNFEMLGEGLHQAAAWFAPRTQAGGLRHLVVDDACLAPRAGWAFLEQCANRGIEIVSFSSFCEQALGKVALGQRLIGELHAAKLDPWTVLRGRLRRWRDLCVAAVALIVAVPLALLLALAIKCDSAGPVFFTQERIGRAGCRFRIFKFRSMHHNMAPGAGLTWTTRADDPRVTRIGAIMRLFHLDELPQLLNVLRGEMSLVGPRPFHPEHCARLEGSPFFRLRLLVSPGITGWAQIRCNYEASIEDYPEVLARDLYYIKHASLLFDLFVMFDTIRVCLWRKGAR